MGTNILDYKFQSETEFNTIVFNEQDRSIDDIKVEALLDNQYIEIYRQDELSNRIAAVEPIKTTAVRVTVESSKEVATLRSIKFENRSPVNRKKIRVVSYLVGPLGENNSFFDKLDVTTDVIMIRYCKWNAEGNIIFSNDEEVLERDVKKLKDATRGKDLKLWFCIGGPDSVSLNNATEILNTDEKRSNLVKQCVEIVRKYGFEGIDVDYEFPSDQKQWQRFGDFLVELKENLALANGKVSCALAPWGVSLSYDAINAIDQVQIMSYDLFDSKRRHATFEKALYGIDYFLELGYKPEQLNVGLALYGRQMDDSPEPWPSYATIINKYGDEIDIYTNSYNNSYFTGKVMNRDKTLLAIDKGIGGVMIWHMACDIPLTEKRSIYRGIQEILDRYIE